MIEIISLRQSYETSDISEVIWTNGADNPADAITKASPNHALRKLIDTNELLFRMRAVLTELSESQMKDCRDYLSASFL